jgi:diguanylate cyclase (GGDEF)-like protein
MPFIKKTSKLLENLYHNFVENGITPGASLREIKNARLTNIFGILCFLYTLFMCIISYFDCDVYLVILNIFTSVFFAGNFYLLSKTKNINLAADIIVILLMITFSFLCFHGGNNGTGPMWSLILPTVALQLKGCRKGTIYTFIYLSVIFIIIFILSSTGLAYNYKNDFSNPESVGLRLILIYLAIFIASYTFTKNKQELILENERLSLTDALTNLPNRRKINETLLNFVEKFKRNNFQNSQMIIKLIEREKLYSFGLILCDIDNFKTINDTYGHPVGDIALKQISKLLVSKLRTVDFVGRWGGEEFLIILDETDWKGTIEVGEKLRGTVEEKVFKLNNIKVNMTLSFGISCFDTMQDINMFISKIDGYLNKAKRKGKNCIVYE